MTFFKDQVNVLIFEKKALLVSISVLNFTFKIYF